MTIVNQLSNADERRAGEREVRKVDGQHAGWWEVYEWQETHGGTFGWCLIAKWLTEADADLLANGPARLARQAAAVAKLRAALEPFAKYATAVDAGGWDADGMLVSFADVSLTIGDCRAARAALLAAAGE